MNVCQHSLKVAPSAHTLTHARLLLNCSEPGFVSKKTKISVAGEGGKPHCFPDRAVRKDVERLEVQCSNWKAGCKWCGKLVDYIAVSVIFKSAST